MISARSGNFLFASEYGGRMNLAMAAALDRGVKAQDRKRYRRRMREAALRARAADRAGEYELGALYLDVAIACRVLADGHQQLTGGNGGNGE